MSQTNGRQELYWVAFLASGGFSVADGISRARFLLVLVLAACTTIKIPGSICWHWEYGFLGVIQLKMSFYIIPLGTGWLGGFLTLMRYS